MNAYPPWEYTYLLPLTMLPVSWAWSCYVLMNVLAVAYLWYFARKTFSRYSKSRIGSACFSFLAISFGAALPCVLFSGNYGLLIAAVSVAMVSALDNKNRIAAGLCWAVLMTKPQLALLLAIPLLGLAMLTGTAWTYSRTHDRYVWVVPILALGLLWNTVGDRRVRRCLSVATFALVASLHVKYVTPGVLWASALPLIPSFKLFEFVAKVHPYIELASVVTVFWAVLFFLSHGGEFADDLNHVKGCQVHKQRPECRLEN